MDQVVSTAMSKNVISVSTSMTIAEVGALFVQRRISGAPVVDDGVLVGSVSATDMLKYLYPTDNGTTAACADGSLQRDGAHLLDNRSLRAVVADVMTRDVLTVRPQNYLRHAATLMYENRVRRVCVVRDGMVNGVLTPFDYVRLFARNRLIVGHSTPTLDF